MSNEWRNTDASILFPPLIRSGQPEKTAMCRLLRTLALLLALFAVMQSANASQCRHVDRLVLGEQHNGLPSFWSDRSVPVWEASPASDRTIEAMSCHDPASRHNADGQIFQPIVGWMSSRGAGDGICKIYNRHLIISLMRGLFAPGPEPRPPRCSA